MTFANYYFYSSEQPELTTFRELTNATAEKSY